MPRKLAEADTTTHVPVVDAEREASRPSEDGAILLAFPWDQLAAVGPHVVAIRAVLWRVGHGHVQMEWRARAAKDEIASIFTQCVLCDLRTIARAKDGVEAHRF